MVEPLSLWRSLFLFLVSGGSMAPRLSDGDEIVYDDEGYLVTPPVRGDLVLVN